MSLEDIVVDDNGNIYISSGSDNVGPELRKYSSSGELLKTISIEASVMTISNNFIFVLNSAGVQKLDTDLNIIATCESQYGGAFWTEIPKGLSISSTSIIASYTNLTYQKYIARLSTSLVFEGAVSGYDLNCIREYNNNFYSTIYNYPDVSLIKINSNFLPESFEYETIGALSIGVGSYFSISSGFLYTPYGDAILKYNISDASYTGSFLGGGSGDGQVSGPTGIFIK